MDPLVVAPYWPFMKVTKATANDETLVMHSYILDCESLRVALYKSSSSYHVEQNAAKRNFIGRANRWLHFQDINYFKSYGFKVYDFGGYAKSTLDAKLKNINNFKKSFGGSIVEESNYVSYNVLLWNRIQKLREYPESVK
jgi:hypothetical protein